MPIDRAVPSIIRMADSTSVAFRPNDVCLDGRKLAGVLIEQADGVAVIGVGINVGQTHFEGELAETAISLHQAGISRDRMEVLEGVLPGIVAAWDAG